MRNNRIPPRHPAPRTAGNRLQPIIAALNTGRFSMAENLCQKLLKSAPKNADAYHLLGVACLQMGRLEDAERQIGQALRLRQDATFHLNLGLVLQARHANAAGAYRDCLRLEPGNAKACNNLANILNKQHKLAEAEQLYRRAIVSQPTYALAFKNLGSLLSDTYRYEEAESTLRQARLLEPGMTDACTALGSLLEKMKRYEEAAELFKSTSDWAALQRVQRRQMDWDNLETIDSAVLQAINTQHRLQAEPWSLLNLPALTPLQHRQAGQQFALHKWAAELRQETAAPAACGAGARLKVGYLSADFYDHATMHLLVGVLEQHDIEKIEVHLYSYGPPRDDAFTQRIVAAAISLRNIHDLSDSEAARLIAADGIQLLVDLKGFTTGARLGISALRPAPVIVSWLGYPGSLGHARLADYIIGDPVVTPPHHAPHFSETLALMPHCYQPNDRNRCIGPRPERQAVGLPESGTVFCSFNQALKINPATFNLWCQLLTEAPTSVLWLLEPDSPTAKNNLRKQAVQRGIDPRRIVFALRLPLEQHLGRLQLADLALDTFPCNSHTTASDALWAGVPLVTKCGELFASRVAASLLTAHGFPELIANNDEEFVELALELVKSPEKLRALRDRLEATRLDSPLFDTTRFTRDLERLYGVIWKHAASLVAERLPIVSAAEEKNRPSDLLQFS
jgi:protein O-GlcNAc transferase